jgi:phospholipase/carboxylesterase
VACRPARIILAGFSQGGAIALASGIRREAGFAGVIALSTYLPLQSSTATEITAGRKTHAGSSWDMAASIRSCCQPGAPPAATNCRRSGLAVQWHSYPMPHSVCAEEIRDLGDWLTARFGAG